MPFELQIIRAGEFIRAGALGKPDVEASRIVLRELARACRRRGIDRSLLDLRTVPVAPKPLLSTNELAMLVNTFHEIGFSRDQWLAVLYTKDPHRGARLFAFISRMRGWNVRAFDDFEKALNWLAEVEHPDQEEQFGYPLPVQHKTYHLHKARSHNGG
jgi:hypothetical protein